MLLIEFLKNNRITYKVFAEQVGCSEVHIAKLANGMCNASLATALQIEEASCGAVTRDEVLFPFQNGLNEYKTERRKCTSKQT